MDQLLNFGPNWPKTQFSLYSWSSPYFCINPCTPLKPYMLPAIQNPSLTAFKPRSVMLSNQAMNNLSNKTSKTLNPCQKKTLLHSSILHYLQRSGFSKTLKYFQREAPIEVKMSPNVHSVMLAFFFLRLDGEKIRLKGRNGFWLLGAVEIFTFFQNFLSCQLNW